MNRLGWTEFPDLLAQLRRRWDRANYLRAYAAGSKWDPVRMSVRGPRSAEVLERFEEVRAWATDLESAASGLEVEFRRVGGRHLGTNRVPARIVVGSFEDLCRLLDKTEEVGALDRLLTETAERLPALLGWARTNPLVVLGHRPDWPLVLSTIQWLAANDTRGLHLREVDVPGVDTKFIERHQGLLGDLLPLILPAGRTDPAAADFARRFGFRAKPSYIRFRPLDPARSPLPAGLSEATLRAEELGRLTVEARTVFVVENEVTYLAFPEIYDSLVIFGSGFASAGLAGVTWMADREVVYWGDIDTHGLDILDRLRASLPQVRSILMDRKTLLEHRQQWVVEPNPGRRRLEHLSELEQEVYGDLLDSRYGPSVRLEQERIGYSSVCHALSAWLPTA